MTSTPTIHHYPRVGEKNTSVCGLSNNPSNFASDPKKVTCRKCRAGMNTNASAGSKPNKNGASVAAKNTAAKKTTTRKHTSALKRETERVQSLAEKGAAVDTPNPVEVSVELEQARVINQLVDSGEDLMVELVSRMLEDNQSPHEALTSDPILQGRLIQMRTILMEVAPQAQGSSLFKLPL